jgi:HK97 family phage major capsid protein
MDLTPQVKAWLVENCDVAVDASDEEFKAAAIAALNDGTLSVNNLAELSKSVDVEEIVAPVEEQKSADEGLVNAFGEITKSLQSLNDRMQSMETVAEEKEAVVEPVKAVEAPVSDGQKMFADASPEQVRVKGAWEQYSTTKSAALNTSKSFAPNTPAEFGGRSLDHSSQLDKAINGAYFKWCVSNSGGQIPRGLRMNDHDKELMEYALRNVAWTGMIGGTGTESGASKVDGRKLTDIERKGILDDGTSGGLEAAPVVFDDAVILTPVLHGELFPLVNTIPISRGRRIEGFALGNPTFTSGTAEGTEIGLFDTSAYISAFDTTIFNAVGAMEIGLDFEEDSPVNIGALVASRYGEKAMEWLDEQIVKGDGTTEPQGLLAASGTTTVSSTNAATGPPVVDDYEGLLFGVAKEFRQAADSARSVFISNDTSYRRARAITNTSSDVRRAFGMETNAHGDYHILGHGYKIQNNVDNRDMVFANLRYYRMYRRLGLNVRVETGGKELARANQKLVVVRMRWGGQLELGGACAKITDGQS